MTKQEFETQLKGLNIKSKVVAVQGIGETIQELRESLQAAIDLETEYANTPGNDTDEALEDMKNIVAENVPQDTRINNVGLNDSLDRANTALHDLVSRAYNAKWQILGKR